MKLTDVIRRPLITEKTTVMREDSQTLVFQVAMDANKIDIRRARRTIRELSARYGLDVDPDELIANLGVGDKQRVDSLCSNLGHLLW